MHSETDKIASKWLGKRFNGSEEYDSSLLVAVPRQENRSHYQITNNELPFIGWDVWHAYEFSAMTENGIPVTRLLKLKYNCNNEFIIESKSLKLYLNSFNMTKIGTSIEDSLAHCKKMIETDLSKKLETEVSVNFIDNSTDRTEIFSKFENIMRFVDENSVTISTFKESSELLKHKDSQEIKQHYLMFDSLRSNCRVTHQPDFGDVFIYYKSSKVIEESSLLQYLVSFRSEYHFHEECCEMIYKRLFDILNDTDELFVCALYTRRGGIDICPARWSKNCKVDDVYNLLDLKKYARCGIKQ